MSSLFEQAYNPDVLSCIANLSNDEVFTPPELANQVLDSLPNSLWSDPSVTFFDPTCKSGVFLREIAKRLIDGLQDEYPNLQDRLDHIYKKQLFGMAITELTSLLSRRSLYCSKYPTSKYSVVRFDRADGNVRYVRREHSWENGHCKYCGAPEEAYARDGELEQYAYEFIHIDDMEEAFPMKFDVIVGNPPYQLGNQYDNQQRDKPIYHLFVERAKALNPRYLTMIIPARWFTGTWNLGTFPSDMLHDRHIRELHDFPDSSDCFPGVEIKGGVCYFLWERDFEGDCEITTHRGSETSSVVRPLLEPGSDVLIRDNEAIPILNKVKSFGEKTFDNVVSSQNPFGFNTAYHGRKSAQKGDIRLITRGKAIEYIKREEVRSHPEWIDEWKVLIPKAGEGGALPNKILGKPFIAEPGTSCTGTYMVIGPFNDKHSCENVISYIQTTLFRYLVSLKKITQDTKAGTYSFVPLQDFSQPWKDADLYEKYGLSVVEIKRMESMITPMDLDAIEL